MRFFDRLIEGVAVLAFAASSLLILINVFNRHIVLGWMRGMKDSAEWFDPVYRWFREAFGSLSVTADEVPGYLLVWVAFLGGYLVMRREGHIAFDMLVEKLPPRGRVAVILLNAALMAGFLVLLFWQSIRMIRVSGRTEIETAEIAQGWFMAIIPIAAILFLLALVLKTRAQLSERF